MFVDYLKEEISDELYNMYLESGDNIRILFKDQWTIVHDLYIPSEYYYSILDYNMFNISLKGLMYDFNKIYEFEEFLTHEDFQKYLDPNSEGLGNGVAPIGAVVTVSTATEVPLDLVGNVTLAAGYENTADVEGMVRAYLADIAYKKTIVPYMSLGAVVQDCPCIDFLSDFKVNGGIDNIALGAEEIAVLNSISLVVVRNG